MKCIIATSYISYKHNRMFKEGEVFEDADKELFDDAPPGCVVMKSDEAKKKVINDAPVVFGEIETADDANVK